MNLVTEKPRTQTKASKPPIDRVRAVRGFVLLGWAGFFAYLYFSGEVSRYLGPRTYWVVPFGTIVLSLAALAHFITLRNANPRSFSWREAAGFLVLLLPVLAVLAVPKPDLGALAASRKTTGGISAGVVRPEPGSNVEVRFLEINYAEESEEYAQAIGATEGSDVELLGFVSKDSGGPEGTFGLTRFYVSCCAADAIPYTVSVEGSEAGGGEYSNDTWLTVKGTLEREGKDLVVAAESITKSEEPDDPYLY
jgi:uncharacterized repeat protein (TIGR03943 family)